MSIVRENLMTRPGYSPYCGNGMNCTMPRTRFDGEQFKCPRCGWRSQFPPEFIAEYKAKWGKEKRYVLHPGYVTSTSDRDRHFIGGPRLAKLYGVDVRDCVYGDVSDYIEQPGDVHLRPRRGGDYVLAVCHVTQVGTE